MGRPKKVILSEETQNVVFGVVRDRALAINKIYWKLDTVQVSGCLYSALQQKVYNPVKLAAFLEPDFIHDVAGLLKDWNLKTFKFNGLFMPRSAR